MLISSNATVKWNSRNKKHYCELGYHFTKMNDPFNVAVEDLTCGTSAIVTLKCDYCGKEYTSTWDKYNEIHKRSEIDKDCCKECAEQKANETIELLYGSHSGLYRSTNAKRTETNLSRYGAENVFGSDVIQDRIVAKNLEKYGVPYTQQNEAIRQKTVRTCQDRYGVPNYVELFKGKFIKENSPVWKGGVAYSRVERATHEYIQWRQSVFSRDLYTCRRCGDKSGRGHEVELHAHHILNWRDHIDSRYDIDNGITLCERCHNDFHSKYGKRHNTQAQLVDFLFSGEKIC